MSITGGMLSKELKENEFGVLLKQRLKTYNTFRPHKALNNLTHILDILTTSNSTRGSRSNTGTKYKIAKTVLKREPSPDPPSPDPR